VEFLGRGIDRGLLFGDLEIAHGQHGRAFSPLFSHYLRLAAGGNVGVFC
jgi:hypothetical protein